MADPEGGIGKIPPPKPSGSTYHKEIKIGVEKIA